MQRLCDSSRWGPYHEAIGEQNATIAEAEELAFLGRRRGAGELPIGERREIAGLEAGPDGVRVGCGEEVAGDRGGAAGAPRRGKGERRREEVLRQARDLAGVGRRPIE